MSALDKLGILKRLGGGKRWEWHEFGEEGIRLDQRGSLGPLRRVIVTYGPYADTVDHIVHASISFRDERIMPDYHELKDLHAAVWPNGHAYQVFVPEEEHVNIRSNALHLWGRLDGSRMMPEFSRNGSI